MTAQKGDDVILKMGDGATPTESFTDIGGVVSSSFRLENEVIDANDLESGAFRKASSQTGIKSLIIRIRGYFTDSAAEEGLRGLAFSGANNNYELHFGNGDKLSGAFMVSSYERARELGFQEDFSVILQSVGNVNFTKAP